VSDIPADDPDFHFEYEGMTCEIHAAMPDTEDCDFCKQEMRARSAHYEAVSEKVNKRGEALARRNGRMDTASLIEMRLNLFIDVVFGQNVRARVIFETKFMEAMHDTLGQALTEITRQQLLMGPQQKQQAFPEGLFGK
jgi:hypothetical protein